MRKKHIVSMACLALAAALAGCAPLAPLNESSQMVEEEPAGPRPVVTIEDDTLRFLYSANSTGGGTLLRGGQVLYKGAPSEDIRLLSSPDTGHPVGWQKGGNGPDGWYTAVYDDEGELLWSEDGEWRAALSDDLLALEPGPRRVDAGPNGETGCRLVDLSNGEEIPLPANTTSCIPTNEDQVVLTVTSDPQRADMESSSVQVMTLDGEELLRVDNAYAFQAYGFEGETGYVGIQIYDASAEEWTTSFYNPATQEYIPRFFSFCGEEMLCYQQADGQYVVRTLDDPAPLAFYDAPCSYWSPDMALVSDGDGGSILYLADGSALPLLSSLSYDLDGESAVFLLEDGSLLICGEDGSQTILVPELHGAAQASIYSFEDGYILLSLESEDYQSVAYQIYDASGLLYDTSTDPGMTYDRLLYLTDGPSGPLYQAAYTGLGNSTLYNVVDSHGNILLSGLADVVSPTVYELPDGIFPARRGFERGFMDYTGAWVYSESVFSSLSDDDGHYYW